MFNRIKVYCAIENCKFSLCFFFLIISVVVVATWVCNVTHVALCLFENTNATRDFT
jgi:hypothetical protein